MEATGDKQKWSAGSLLRTKLCLPLLPVDSLWICMCARDS